MISMRARPVLHRYSAWTRSFFASSTDHTTLLGQAEIHKLRLDDRTTQYVLAPRGTEPAIVKSVPQLHLARLTATRTADDAHIVKDAKVVQRTLGSTAHVCQPLLQAAVADHPAPILAHSTLHGLSQWAAAQAHECDATRWEELARLFVAQEAGDESVLYTKNGGVLESILPDQDKSEFADTCRGTMAVFRLE